MRTGENVLPNGKTLFVEKNPEKEEIDRKVHNLLFQTFRIVIELRMFREYGRGVRAMFSRPAGAA